jgi:flagellar L-ring protein precursor FlgH
MIPRGVVVALLVIASVWTRSAFAQTSSLGVKARQARVGQVPEVQPREAPKIRRNAVYDRYSWITAKPAPPKVFRVGDLITIVVRERRKFEAESDLETKKRFKLKSTLDAFITLTQGGVGAAAFQRGKPAIEYKYDNRLKTEGDAEREDRFTTRLTGKIVDVKPNGLLVLEAWARIEHDDEISTITFTGTCRKEDVTADNTVLSTQVAGKNIVVTNEGALRAASSRGWMARLIDLLGPF